MSRIYSRVLRNTFLRHFAMLRSCHTCRQGRKGCDKTRPTCRTCWKNGLKCGGYRQDKQAFFVNLDATNIQAGTKSIFSNAIRDRRQEIWLGARCSSSRPYHQMQEIRRNDLFGNSINCLDLTELDFKDHLAVLWNHFHLQHSSSSDAWAPAFTPLINKNRFLDLALIALSALRFSQTTADSRIRLMSLTAYGQSLRIFRQACTLVVKDPTKYGGVAAARLATTSLVYTMFEAMHESPRTIFSSGIMFDNTHLKGARSFMQGCGPSSFQLGGDHLAFKKLREMIILDGFVHHEKSILADPCWMTEPWQKNPKTRRDALFDVAAQMTGLVSIILTQNTPLTVTGTRRCNPKTRDLAETLDLQIGSWERTWHESLRPASFTTLISFVQNPQAPLRYAGLNSTTADIIFLQLELWSLKLLLAICNLHQDTSLESDASILVTKLQPPNDILKDLSTKVETALKNPLLRQNDDRDQGIVEGQCRSLLPAWTLMEYKRCF